MLSEAETWRVNTGDPFLFRLLAKILHVELVRRIVKLFCGDELFDLFILLKKMFHLENKTLLGLVHMHVVFHFD